MVTVNFRYNNIPSSFFSPIDVLPLKLLFERFSKDKCSLCGSDLSFTDEVVVEPVYFCNFTVANCFVCKTEFFVNNKFMISSSEISGKKLKTVTKDV